MAFWEKKGADPWDIDPEKRKKEREREQEKKARRQEPQIPPWYRKEEPAEPEKCPRCGQPMLRGVLYGGSRQGFGMRWKEGEYKGFLDSLGPTEKQRRLDLGAYEEAWFCEACQKMVLDIDAALRSVGPNYQWKDGKIVFPDGEETEA